MSATLSVEQRVHLLTVSDDERLAYFLEAIKTTQTVWSLSNDEGFVMVETDDGDCVMLWPDEDFAAQWAVDEWDDCQPTQIELGVFQNQWLPSLLQDEIAVAVFPNIEDEGKLLKAAELIAMLNDQKK